MKRFYLYHLSILLVMPFTLTGCSLIGYYAGKSASREAHDIPKWRIPEIKPGTTIIAVMKDSTSVTGRYRALRKMELDAYAETWREQGVDSATTVPFSPGKNVHLLLSLGRKQEGSFGGLFLEGRAFTMALTPEKKRTITVQLAKIVSISGGSGDTLSSAELLQMVQAGRLPMGMEVHIRTDSGEQHINLNSIERTHVPASNLANRGLTIGAIIDATVIIAVAYIISHMTLDFSSGGGLLYSVPIPSLPSNGTVGPIPDRPTQLQNVTHAGMHSRATSTQLTLTDAIVDPSNVNE